MSRQDLGEILNKPDVRFNLSLPVLMEIALKKQEGCLTKKGSILVTNSKYTGRSPNDKFFVMDDNSKDTLNWGNVNRPISPENFQKLYDDMMAYLKEKELYVFDGFGGADPQHRYNLRFINEYAWQNIFARHLFIRPTPEELQNFTPEYHIVAAPGFKTDPAKHGTNSEVAVVINLTEKLILIAGTFYAGEIKKSVFTLMNYLHPLQNILSMHCSANVDAKGQTALFFGLSGTGKTTLSTDPERRLVGDDQHGWSDVGIFNIEGGCYAKCINLSPVDEPQIYNALQFGAILENVVMEEQTRELDFDDGSITENTRAGYPMDYIPNCLIPSYTGHPEVIFFLTADAFGVLPPVAILNENQAMYHFLSGYTSKLAGTERGVKEPQTTFSACFGAPFLPLSPVKYVNLLGERIKKHNTRVYLINTGWTGGPYGIGHRFKIPHTRALIKAALEGTLETQPSRLDPIFGFKTPCTCPDVPDEIFYPERTWTNAKDYQVQAHNLALAFQKNFAKFKNIPEEILQASPKTDF